LNASAGWTSDAVALVERAIAAHGGREVWQQTSAVQFSLVRGTGALLALKGFGRTFPAPRAFEVRPHDRVTIFHRYPDDRHVGRFADGTVSIEDLDGREAPLTSVGHRHTFEGFAKYRRWSSLDALYFFGYALWHYHVLPFTLGEARLLRVLTRAGTVEGIDVLFPHTIHTHSRRQQFYFGDDGRIVRHDYVAEVVGGWAHGAHFWEDYDASGQLSIARRRRVVFRAGRYLTPFRALEVQFGEVSCQLSRS
jgi:hypothetical protein